MLRLSDRTLNIITAVGVMIQPILILMQQCMIGVLGMDEEATTSYRVLLTITFLLPAILIAFIRRPRLFIVTYLVAFIILSLNLILFPANTEYLLPSASRFLLPVVIPSALCIISVSNIDDVEYTVYKLSWIAAIIMLFYFFNLLIGKVIIMGYNMSLSYALLLPTVTLYHKKSALSLLASLFLFLMIVALGSRGAAVFALAYVCYDILISNRKLILPIIIIVLGILALLPIFLQFLTEFGINSRTLMMLLEGDFASDSGRGGIYEIIAQQIAENPLLGIGLFGDRTVIGNYCHNFILEIISGFGVILGGTIILFFFTYLIATYFKNNRQRRDILIRYSIISIAPLLVSGSYLQDYNLAAMLGIAVLINRKRQNPAIPNKVVRIGYDAR